MFRQPFIAASASGISYGKVGLPTAFAAAFLLSTFSAQAVPMVKHSGLNPVSVLKVHRYAYPHCHIGGGCHGGVPNVPDIFTGNKKRPDFSGVKPHNNNSFTGKKRIQKKRNARR